MSRFDEMVQAASDGEERNKRVIKFIEDFITRFVAYCEIPPQNIKVLPWVEKVQAFHAKTNEMFSIPQAIDYDDANDQWRIGICVVVRGTAISPNLAAIGGMLFKESDSQFSVRFGDDKPLQPIDLNVQAKCETVFNGIVKEAMECLRGRKPVDAKFGFHTQLG